MEINKQKVYPNRTWISDHQEAVQLRYISIQGGEYALSGSN